MAPTDATNGTGRYAATRLAASVFVRVCQESKSASGNLSKASTCAAKRLDFGVANDPEEIRGHLKRRHWRQPRRRLAVPVVKQVKQ